MVPDGGLSRGIFCDHCLLFELKSLITLFSSTRATLLEYFEVGQEDARFSWISVPFSLYTI